MTAFTRAELMAWHALLDAALDQPRPTRALVRAIEDVIRLQQADPVPPRSAPKSRRTQRREQLAVMVALMREDRAA
jgi:hypothetical protein